MLSRTTMYCPSCQANNVYSKLKLHQISLTAAVYLCEDKTCPYPKGYDWIEVKRSLDELLYEKQQSTTGDSDLDNWLEEAFEREMSNANNITCKNVITAEYNNDNFLAEVFKELESNMVNVEDLPIINNVTRSEENVDSSSCNYFESLNVRDFENENFVIDFKNG